MSIRRVFVILLVVELFNLSARETLDPDMWWHLRTGEIIWTQGIPRQDVFSFTVSDHAWITHEWLSEAFMWIVYRFAGLPGLSLAFAAFAALAFWLVFRRTEGRPYLAGILITLAAVAAVPSLGARPQTFNVLLAAVFIYIVEGFRAGQVSRRMLWVLPFLTALWANLHGGYLLGVVLLSVYAAGESFDRIVGAPNYDRASRGDVAFFVVLAAACFAAAVLNPNGWHLWTYAFETLGSAAMQKNIAEWRPPDFHDPSFWPFAVLMGLGVVGWTVSRVRPSCTDLFLFLGTAAAGLTSRRHIALFAVIATPAISRALLSALRDTKVYPLLSGEAPPTPLTPLKTRLNWTMLVAVIAATATWITVRLAKNETAIAKAYPVAAVDFLEREGLATKHGFNAYVWGGYLIWRGVPVFVDGRADVYGDFLTYYLKTFQLTDDWREPLDAFDVKYALVERKSALSTLLGVSDEWREVYADDTARIFVRNEGAQQLDEKD